MNIIVSIIMLFSLTASITSYQQNISDNYFILDTIYLDDKEVKLLNDLLGEGESYDFYKKKIIFVTGPAGHLIVNKDDFFNDNVYPVLEKGDKPILSMIKLSDIEKQKAGGYDVIVLAYVKALTNRQKKRIIKSVGKDSCEGDILISQIRLYDYYTEDGTTTAGALNIFSHLQADKVRTIEISESEFEMIRTIISKSKTVKYPKWFQTKTGIYLLFFEFKETESKIHRMYLVYDDAFVDIDNNVHYRVEDGEQKLWIRQFQEKYRGKSLDWK